MPNDERSPKNEAPSTNIQASENAQEPSTKRCGLGVGDFDRMALGLPFALDSRSKAAEGSRTPRRFAHFVAQVVSPTGPGVRLASAVFRIRASFGFRHLAFVILPARPRLPSSRNVHSY